MLLIIKTDGEVQQKTISEVYEKLNLLEDGMKNFFAEGKPSVDHKNSTGLLDIIFFTMFDPYKVQEEVLGIKFIVPEKFPVLFSWLMAILELNVVKEASLPHDKAVGILQFISAFTSSASA
ncbi:Glutathione S-transferase U9 [Spatholobus suberectus]|nr:Glutathione S-transferase U9 [Spatholobus suberectus]